MPCGGERWKVSHFLKNGSKLSRAVRVRVRLELRMILWIIANLLKFHVGPFPKVSHASYSGLDALVKASKFKPLEPPIIFPLRERIFISLGAAAEDSYVP